MREQITLNGSNGFGSVNGKHNGKNHNGHESMGMVNEMGDMHVGTSMETPMHKDAFKLSDEEKISIIEQKFREILETLGMDLTDDSLRGTPHRVSKMYVKEIFYGLNPANKPKISVFDNKFRYSEMLVEKEIQVQSFCEHHFLPIVGRAHVGYISNGVVIGLSKINRIVDYFARRPQVQERLTVQIANELKKALNTEDIAVVIDAKHMCVSCRGIQDDHSSTVTSEFSGKFHDRATREEFLKYIRL